MEGEKNQAEVDCAWMDGRKKAVLWGKCSLPGSLSFSSEGRVLYWADTGENSAALPVGLAPFLLTVFFLIPSVEGVISSIGLDGTGYKQYKSGPGLLVSFTHTENVLIWATRQKGQKPLSAVFLSSDSRWRQNAAVTRAITIKCLCNRRGVYSLSDPGLGLIFTSTQWVSLHFKTVDVTKLWFSDGLQPNQLWFETKTNLVEVRAYSTSSQSGRRFCLSSKQSGQSVES